MSAHPTRAKPRPAMNEDQLAPLLARVAEALERLAPARQANLDPTTADAFVWRPETEDLTPVPKVSRVAIDLLVGIDPVRDVLLENTLRFASGMPANNALLWGARGMGKSSLVKAVHAKANETKAGSLALVEIHREDIASLPRLLARLGTTVRRYILYCDDLSFDLADTSYKSLKAVLEGGIEGRPGNIIFYATSNRRHMMPREMIDNERSTAINPSDAVEEKVSLSDRFGLWLGFHSCSQEEYLTMIDGYVSFYGLEVGGADIRAEAIEWSVTRGARSGRVAWQFVQNIAGRLGQPLVET